MGTFTVHVINVKILPYARIVEKTSLYLKCISWSLIIVLQPLNMWELYITIDWLFGLNRVVTSKDTVFLICLNQQAEL